MPAPGGDARVHLENKALRKRVEAAERENFELKKTVYDLSLRLSAALAAGGGGSGGGGSGGDAAVAADEAASPPPLPSTPSGRTSPGQSPRD